MSHLSMSCIDFQTKPQHFLMAVTKAFRCYLVLYSPFGLFLLPFLRPEELAAAVANAAPTLHLLRYAHNLIIPRPIYDTVYKVRHLIFRFHHNFLLNAFRINSDSGNKKKKKI